VQSQWAESEALAVARWTVMGYKLSRLVLRWRLKVRWEMQRLTDRGRLFQMLVSRPQFHQTTAYQKLSNSSLFLHQTHVKWLFMFTIVLWNDVKRYAGRKWIILARSHRTKWPTFGAKKQRLKTQSNKFPSNAIYIAKYTNFTDG